MNPYDASRRELGNEVRKIMLASQAPGRFGRGYLEFDKAQEEANYFDAEALLQHLGIELLDDNTAICFCGSSAAEWNPRNRRYACSKTQGCGINWVNLTRLVEKWLERGLTKPINPGSSSLPSGTSTSSKGSEVPAPPPPYLSGGERNSYGDASRSLHYGRRRNSKPGTKKGEEFHWLDVPEGRPIRLTVISHPTFALVHRHRRTESGLANFGCRSDDPRGCYWCVVFKDKPGRCAYCLVRVNGSTFKFLATSSLLTQVQRQAGHDLKAGLQMEFVKLGGHPWFEVVDLRSATCGAIAGLEEITQEYVAGQASEGYLHDHVGRRALNFLDRRP